MCNYNFCNIIILGGRGGVCFVCCTVSSMQTEETVVQYYTAVLTSKSLGTLPFFTAVTEMVNISLETGNY